MPWTAQNDNALNNRRASDQALKELTAGILDT